MTEKDVSILAFSLADTIEKDPRVISMKTAEKAMEENDEIGHLAYAFDLAQTHYNDLLKIYSETAPEAQSAQKDLYLKKKALDEHPLVREYLHCYQDVRLMYDTLQNELFAPFNEHLCGEKR